MAPRKPSQPKPANSAGCGTVIIAVILIALFVWLISQSSAMVDEQLCEDVGEQRICTSDLQ